MYRAVFASAAFESGVNIVSAATVRLFETTGGAQNQLTRQIVERLAEALEKSGVDIVPRIQITSGATDQGPLNALIGMLLSQKGQDLLGREETKEAA